jgi:hypothetical protein
MSTPNLPLFNTNAAAPGGAGGVLAPNPAATAAALAALRARPTAVVPAAAAATPSSPPPLPPAGFNVAAAVPPSAPIPLPGGPQPVAGIDMPGMPSAPNSTGIQRLTPDQGASLAASAPTASPQVPANSNDLAGIPSGFFPAGRSPATTSMQGGVQIIRGGMPIGTPDPAGAAPGVAPAETIFGAPQPGQPPSFAGNSATGGGFGAATSPGIAGTPAASSLPYGLRDPTQAAAVGFDRQNATTDHFMQESLNYIEAGNNIYERATRGRAIAGILHAVAPVNNAGSVFGAGIGETNQADAAIQGAQANAGGMVGAAQVTGQDAIARTNLSNAAALRLGAQEGDITPRVGGQHIEMRLGVPTAVPDYVIPIRGPAGPNGEPGQVTGFSKVQAGGMLAKPSEAPKVTDQLLVDAHGNRAVWNGTAYVPQAPKK